MQIGEGGELLFSTPMDHQVLREIAATYRNDPDFDLVVGALKRSLAERVDLGDVEEEISPEQLTDLMRESEEACLEVLGISPRKKPNGISPNIDHLWNEIIRRATAYDQPLTYILPPKWTPVVLAGALRLSDRIEIWEYELEAARLNLPSGLLVGKTDEELAEIFEDADRLATEEGIDILGNDELSRQMRPGYAKEQLSQALSAAELLIELVNKYGL